MKPELFLKLLKKANTAFDLFYFDGCPCFGPIEVGDIVIKGFCWRAGPQEEGCGLIVDWIPENGLYKEIIDELHQLLTDMPWFGDGCTMEWEVIENDRSW